MHQTYDALCLANLDGDDVLENYAACVKLGVPARADFTRLDLDELEEISETW